MIPGIVAAGLAVTGVFEPPVSDATFADVVFLCSWNGADNATVATDDSLSAHAITFHGNAKLNTSVKQFGTASLELDGVGDYASVANHSDFHFGTGPFCIEGFVRPDTSVFQDSTLVGMWTDDSLNPQRGWRVSYTNEGLQFRFSTTGTNSSILLSAPSTIDLNTQHHFCVQRNDNALMQMFVDGVEVDSATSAANLWPSTLDLTIGANFDTVVAGALSGHIDEVRITRNWWYDGDFTVPVAEYDRPIDGALTGIEGADAADFVADLIVQGVLAATSGADLAAFEGLLVPLGGTLTATEGADAAAFTGDIVSIFQGALVKKTADQTAANFSSFTVITWDAEEFDTDGVHDNVTDNSRITIPSALNGKYGILRANVELSAVSVNASSAIYISKGGTAIYNGIGNEMHHNGAFGSVFIGCRTQPILLSTNDYFEALIHCSDTSVTLESEVSSFSLEVVG